MLQVANTDPLNPLVPEAHNSHKCQNLLFPLQIKSQLKLACGFYLLHPRHIWVKHCAGDGVGALLPSSHVKLIFAN